MVLAIVFSSLAYGGGIRTGTNRVGNFSGTLGLVLRGPWAMSMEF